MKVLKCPSKTILDCSLLNESILIGMKKIQNNSLKSIGQELGYDFNCTVEEGYWSEIISSSRAILLGNEGYIGGIDAL